MRKDRVQGKKPVSTTLKQCESAWPEMYTERYKFILQQLHSSNENVHRFLALYQTLATTLTGAGLALFVGYKKWGIDPGLAKVGIFGACVLTSFVAGFTLVLIVAGVSSWFDYRREECLLLSRLGLSDLREPPRLRNLYRWYETYVCLFVLGTLALIWIGAVTYVAPAVT